ncbi:hypothetical protein [Streptomyces sp. 900105245]
MRAVAGVGDRVRTVPVGDLLPESHVRAGPQLPAEHGASPGDLLPESRVRAGPQLPAEHGASPGAGRPTGRQGDRCTSGTGCGAPPHVTDRS